MKGTSAGFGAGVFIGLLLFVGLAAWLGNILWTFQQTEIAPMVLGIVGVFVPPLGLIHGVWLWF